MLTRRGRMKRPLDESDVAEQLAEPRRVRIVLGASAPMRQQNDRKIPTRTPGCSASSPACANPRS